MYSYPPWLSTFVCVDLLFLFVFMDPQWLVVLEPKVFDKKRRCLEEQYTYISVCSSGRVAMYIHMFIRDTTGKAGMCQKQDTHTQINIYYIYNIYIYITPSCDY